MLAPFDDALRFQPSSSAHLTLMFFRELMEIEYRGVCMAAQSIAAATRHFTVRTNGIGTFGSRGRETVLYFDVVFSDELARLKKRCPWPNEKPFHPHITIARIAHANRFAVHAKEIRNTLRHASLAMTVDRLRLYATIDGNAQTPLEDFPLS